MERDGKRGHLSVSPVGATALLTVFAVLCLAIFSLLTLSDVRSDARLAEASLDSISAYYKAEVTAQELLARLRNGEQPEGVALSGTAPLQADYAVPISQGQELRVQVLLTGEGYQITRWQSAPTDTWEGEDHITVWTPD